MTSSFPTSLLARAVILGLLALAGLTAAVALLKGPPSGPTYPDEWDARVLPLVEEVEELRGLKFKHPVFIDFLPVEEFKEDVRSEQGDLTEEDQEELEQTVGVLRALGLVSGELDLFEAMQDLSAGGTLAYYTTEHKRIRVRGTEMTPDVTHTVVHELVHALQDQHFDIGAALESFDDDEGTAASVYRAVVEGDASRIATAWATKLPADERQELTQLQIDGVEENRKEIADIPGILVTLMSAPYALGEPLVTLVGSEGNEAVDALFDDPPRTEEVLLDPFIHGTPAEEPVDVPDAESTGATEAFDSGEFGALTLYLVLAERLDAIAALAAADGWGGDHYTAREVDGRTCVSAVFTGDSPDDTTELADALRSWADGGESEADVRREGDLVHLHTCDPGPGAAPRPDTSGASEEALTAVATRSAIASMLIDQAGMPAPVARCTGGAMLEEFTMEELNSTDMEALADLQERMMKVMTGCLSAD